LAISATFQCRYAIYRVAHHSEHNGAPIR
jgi:hypothetical protein